ncbi:hypothetical protein ACFQO7_28225 [Catellatospora aurea]|uniref:DUF4131 domain-containing protein n=1 Tax=Catellatospora aurea TaxID=1337874 RepID=A0ABW2H6W6_9ACTN
MVHRVTGPDGHEWWVGRRWLPWRPARRRRDGESLGDSSQLAPLAGADGMFGCVMVLMIIVAFPVVLLLVFLAIEWLVVLLLLPLWVLARVLFGVPWVIVARGRSADGRRWRYYGRAAGWRGSAALIDAVREEVRLHGAPRSLGAPVVAEQDDIVVSGEESLQLVQSGEPLEIQGQVYGTTSPYARNGWLSGWLRADEVSLSISQAGGVARRAIPVLGGAVLPETPSTKADRAAIGDLAVIGVTGADGREYRIAVDPDELEALRWLQSRWTAPH